jgi:diguanylate cyclase (GGDEF)-like protein
MVYNFSIISGIVLFSSAVTLYLLLLGFQRRKVRGAWSFTILMACLFLYSFGASFEFMSGRVSDTLMWTHFEYLGISFLPMAIILFSVDYCAIELPGKSAIVALLCLFSLFTLVTQLTTETGRLFYRNVRMRFDGPIPTISFEPGPVYLFHQIYLAVAMCTSFVLSLRQVIISSGFFRKQAFIIFASSLFPITGYILYIFNLTPGKLDVSPIAFSFMSTAMAFGLFKFKLFDLEPVMLRSVFETMREGCIVLDRENRLVDCNGVARSVLPGLSGYRAGDNIEGALRVRPELLSMIQGGGESDIDLLLDGKGETRCFNVSLSKIADRKGRILGKTVILNDVSRQYRLAGELRELAIHDELTGLFTRRYLYEIVDRIIDQARRSRHPVSLIMADLDRFKLVNDEYGHQAGDEVLKAFSQLCRDCVRSSDVIFRYGGEEFLILLPETTREAAEVTAQRIRAAVKIAGIPDTEREIRFTASFGVAGLSTIGRETIADLIKQADTALYEAKAAGRDRVMVFGSL